MIDDEPALLRVLALTLHCSHPGAAIELFDSGEAALRRAELASFELAVIDLQMPHMDGVATAVGLRALLRDLPVVFVTADIDCELAGCARELQRACVLDKLFLHYTLDVVVARMLKSSVRG